MFEDTGNRATEKPERHAWSSLHAVLYVAIALLLIGNVYLLSTTSRLATGVSQVQKNLDTQIASVNSQLSAKLDESRQHAISLAQDARDSALAAAERAKVETRQSAAKVSARLAQQQRQQQQVAGELNDLKQTASNADSRITEVSTDVSRVKADVASTQAELHETGSDLKRAKGDMGVMSGLIATNSNELAELRQLGERNYFEFDIKKATGAKKIGDISLAVRKVDPKRNRFTLLVMADDKTVEKRDKTINEPVQFYMAGSRQPYEIVINQVKKDQVIGYLATPKMKLARR